MNNPAAAALAVGAAAMFGTADALEHHVVSNLEPNDAGRSLMGRLWRSRRWIVGISASVLGFVCYATALSFGSLLFVQPIIVLGLLVALALSGRWAHRSLAPREWLAAALLCVGLAVFLIEAAPTGGADSASVARWAIVATPVFAWVLAAGLASRRSTGGMRAALLAFAAGSLYGLTSALTKTFSAQVGHGPVYTAEHWEVYGLAIISITGIVLTQHAFQAKSLTSSLPVLQVTEPIGACIVGWVLLGERIHGSGARADALIAISIAVMVAAVVDLARYAGTVRERSAAGAGRAISGEGRTA